MSILNIICLFGPTSIGKTKFAIELSKVYPIEIISMDSCMVYKFMNIGTGKPPNFVLNEKFHHLINICDPEKNFSIFDYLSYSTYFLNYCYYNNKIPFFVGGSFMYFWYLNKFLFSKINKYKFTFKLNLLNLSIIPFDSYFLYKSIKNRFFLMLKKGFIDEVYCLYRRPNLSLNNLSMKSIGYFHIWKYINGDYNFDKIKELIIRSTIDLSKKQLDWLKKFEFKIHFVENIKLNNIYFFLNLFNEHF